MGYSTNSSKLQGDPGLFGSLGGLIGKAAGFIPGPIGTIAGLLGGAGGGGRRAPTVGTPPFTMPGGGRGTPTSFGQQMVPTPGVGGAIERFLPGGNTGFQPGVVRKKRRRMDPLNVKALRRSTRRLAAFQREAKKVEKEIRKLAPPARRRSSSAHHHHPKA